MIDILLGLLREVVAPSRCAACDARIAPAVLFCAPCAATIERAEREDAAFAYGGAMMRAILRLKYEDRPDLAAKLGRAMIPAAQRHRGAIDLVVPVPLHARRLAVRGYNQSALLARPLARALGVPMAARALRRVRDTPKQASLSREARLRNVVAAFRSERTLPEARVLLVDDVATSGATLEACMVALLAAGVRETRVLVLARA